MSYDLHCYRTRLKEPTIDEVEELIEDEDYEKQEKYDKWSNGIKQHIINSLLEVNDELEVYQPNEDTMGDDSFIELITPEGDLPSQIMIMDNYVTIMVPYGYSRKEARSIFKNVDEYIKSICKVINGVVYDPQTEKIFDPLTISASHEALQTYEKVVNQLYNPPAGKEKKWWKFW